MTDKARKSDREPVYLDYAATTPVDPRVAERMADCLTPDGIFANPASAHLPGRRARAMVEEARASVAGLLGAEPREIVWTSGATEANNLAIVGAARFHRDRGRHLVTSPTEHKAVVDVVRHLERQEGFEVTWLEPGQDGLVTVDQVAGALRNDTVLVSLMHVNNEIGVIQPIEEIARLTREQGILFHVDAAQAAGKLPIRLDEWPVDLLSVSAHKLYGPKGIGVLFQRRRPRARMEPLIRGGGQERGLRSGTLPTHQIVGMGVAAELAVQELADEGARLTGLRQRIEQRLLALPGTRLNGHTEQRVPGIVNISFDQVHGEALTAMLDPHVAVSSGSACSSATAEPSYVLRALGRSDSEAEGSLRLSVGRFTTERDVDRAVEWIERAVERLRALSPRASDSGRAAVSR